MLTKLSVGTLLAGLLIIMSGAIDEMGAAKASRADDDKFYVWREGSGACRVDFHLGYHLHACQAPNGCDTGEERGPSKTASGAIKVMCEAYRTQRRCPGDPCKCITIASVDEEKMCDNSEQSSIRKRDVQDLGARKQNIGRSKDNSHAERSQMRDQHPHMREALKQLRELKSTGNVLSITISEVREARREVEDAAHDFGGHKREAIEALDAALKQLQRHDRRADKDIKEAADNAIRQLEQALAYDRK